MKKFIRKLLKSVFVAFLMFMATLNLSPGIVFADTVTDSYADTSKINTGASSNYEVTGGQLKIGYDLKGWWKMDEATGQTAADSSGNGNTGTAYDTGLKAYWKMDEASGNVADSSGNGYTGTVTGTTVVAGQSGYGNARSFNGTSSDYITASSSINPSSGITIEYWLKKSGTAVGMPILKGANNQFYTYDNGSQISLKINTSAGSMEQYSGVTFNDGVWHHFTTTWSNSDGKIRIYKDGVLAVTSTGSLLGTLNAQANSLTIGAGRDMGGYYWLGVLDDVRIYNYARSLAQISDDKNNNAPVSIVSGQYSNARSFNGTSDYIDLGLNKIAPLIDGATSITFESWINPSALPASGARSRIISVNLAPDVGAGSAFVLTLFNNAGTVQLEAGGRSVRTDSYQTGRMNWTGGTGTWYHVAGVINFTAKTITPYINGVAGTPASVTFANNSLTNATPTAGFDDTIGGYMNNGLVQDFWSGSIDDVRVYNYGRTLAEIQNDMNNTLSTSATVVSTNLLTGVSGVDGIDEFVYNLSSKPTGTTATVQFSQNGTNWYNSSGVLTGTDTLTTGTNNTIVIRNLTWSGSNFYYKIAYTGDGTNTPVLDDVNVNYTVSGYTNTSNSVSDPYDNTNLINTSSSTNEYVAGSQLKIFPNVDLGDGADGAVTIAANKNINTDTIAGGRTVADGINYKVTSLGTNTIAVSPLGWWKMDEASGNVLDSSGNNYTGTPTGTTVVAGQYGNARNFAGGTDNISMGNVLDQTGANPLSIEAWVKTTAGGATVYTIVSKDLIGTPYTGYQLGFNVVTASAGDAGKIGFFLSDTTPTYFRRQTTATYNDGNWHHVAATYDGSKTRAGALIYIDGSLATVTDHDSASFAGSTSNSVNFQIGARNGNNQPFVGQIDDVRFYDYVRSAPQIADDKNNAALMSGMAAGDDILLINLQGDTTNNSNAGTYEIRTIQSVSGDTITLTSNITGTYGVGGNANLTGQKIMIQRVPNYTNVTINGGFTLTADAWNGTKGGIVAFKANGTVSVAGNISTNSLGFRGGSGAPGPNQNNGYNGEGINNPTRTQSGCQNSGGGSAGAYTGGATGGGGGSYGTAGTGSATSCDGYPGTTYGASTLSQLFLGSGGGGGSSWGDGTGSGSGGTGNTGGGMIIISATTFTNSGTVSANGANGVAGVTHGAGGGGGSGGTIFISTSGNTTTGTMTATGGSGGTGYSSQNGGTGGAGRIGIGTDGTISGTTNPVYSSVNPLGGSGYLTSASILSTNLLTGISNISSINSFVYNLATLPAGTTATIQFSQGGSTNWYNSSGAAGGTNTLTTGANNTISLSGLAWSGANFYYKIAYTSDTTATPTLNDITVNYTTSTSSVGSTWAACLPLPGGNFTITTNCYFPNTQLSSPETNIDGVDNGDLIIQAYKTLTIRGDQQIVRNNGKYVQIGTVSSIAINDIPEGGVGGNVRDYSGNNNEGTAFGATVVAGKYNKARSFNGTTDYIDVGNETAFDFERTNSFSVSFWLKTTGSAGVALVSKLQSSGNFTGWEIAQPAADPSKVQVNLINTTATNEARKRSSISVNTGAWKHIAFTYDGSSTAAGIKIYIDGVLDSSATTVADTLTGSILNDINLNIGARVGTIPFNGQMDDIRIYNYARSDTQIIEDRDYQTPTGNGSIAWWRFEDGGQIKETNLWIQDNDGDGWAQSVERQQKAQTNSPGTGWVRRYLTIGSAFGDARDGNITFDTNTNLNTYTDENRSCAYAINYNVSSFGTTTLPSTVGGQTVSTAVLTSTPSSGCLNAGDNVLVINLQGTTTYSTNVGNYELLKVFSVNGSTVTFTPTPFTTTGTGLKKNYYGNGATDDTNLGTATTNQRVMLQRIPQFGDVTVNTGVSVTPSAWDGAKGGVLALSANGTVTVTGTIHTDSLGYRRGGNNANQNGESFDGYNGYGGTSSTCGGANDASTAVGAACNRGGGGGSGNTVDMEGGGGGGGYGGGGGGGSGGAWWGGGCGGTQAGGTGGNTGIRGGGGAGGAGDTCGAPAGGAAGSNGGTAGTGGGLGGAVAATDISTAQGGGLSSFNYLSIARHAGGGGGGGGLYGNAELSKLFFGSGGGSSAQTDSTPDGGYGAGIIYISAKTLTVTGAIRAQGSKGQNAQEGTGDSGSAGGGGGAGGSILIKGTTVTLGGNLVSAPVTAVSNGWGSPAGPFAGGGGAGGVGRIAVGATNTPSGTTNPTYTSITGP